MVFKAQPSYFVSQNIGGIQGCILFIYFHINVKIPPVWYFLKAVPSPIWDLQYYLTIPWYSDNLNPTLVVTTVVLPPIFLLTK